MDVAMPCPICSDAISAYESILLNLPIGLLYRVLNVYISYIVYYILNNYILNIHRNKVDLIGWF